MNRVVYTLGNDVSTDVIYPGRYMATVLPTETPQYAFADDPEFQARVQDGSIPTGSIIVAGENFGCGSSREQAASALKAHALTVVAKGFARIFLQNAINVGLTVVTCPMIEAKEGDELNIGMQEIQNVTSGIRYTILPLPKAGQEIVNAGGLIPYARERVKRGSV